MGAQGCPWGPCGRPGESPGGPWHWEWGPWGPQETSPGAQGSPQEVHGGPGVPQASHRAQNLDFP